LENQKKSCNFADSKIKRNTLTIKS
jgi:hypothetical protein